MIDNVFFSLVDMDRNGKMIQQIMQDEEDFDADDQEHLSITGWLQEKLDDVEQRKKGPRGGGSKPERKKSKPRRMFKVGPYECGALLQT
jgi:hypothetical protein